MRYFKNPFLATPVSAGTTLTEDGIRTWARQLLEETLAHQDNVMRSLDGGLYLGPAGVAYAHWYAHRKGISPNGLAAAAELSKIQLQFLRQRQSRQQPTDAAKESVGFLIGGSGAHAVAAAIARDAGDSAAAEEQLRHFAAAAQPAIQDVNGSDEFLVGRAGYVCGALWLREVFGREVVPLRDLVSICSAMVAKGAHYARRNRSPSPLMYEYYGTEYLGAAHGLSSILQVMLSVPGFMASQSEESAKLVKDSVDYMLGLQGPSGNIPCAMDAGSSSRGERTRKMCIGDNFLNFNHISKHPVHSSG